MQTIFVWVCGIPDGDGHWGDPQINVLCSAQVDWYEGQPDDAGGVHWESNELGLIEGLRDLSGEDRVHRANDH